LSGITHYTFSPPFQLSKVYQGDATLKNIVLDRFEPSGENVKAVLKMTFDSSNNNPGAKLKDSLSNGKLGSIGVDKDSVSWINSYSKSLIYVFLN
jgi:hypothetical protein